MSGDSRCTKEGYLFHPGGQGVKPGGRGAEKGTIKGLYRLDCEASRNRQEGRGNNLVCVCVCERQREWEIYKQLYML